MKERAALAVLDAEEIQAQRPQGFRSDLATSRNIALSPGKATGELLPGCVIVLPSEHFGVSFGKDSGERDSTGDE